MYVRDKKDSIVHSLKRERERERKIIRSFVQEREIIRSFVREREKEREHTITSIRTISSSSRRSRRICGCITRERESMCV